MYWIFFILFVVGVLAPDIIRDDAGFLAEERAEELVIFLLGSLGFLIFLFKEKQLMTEKREKEKNQKQLNETGKDLMESYSYIGEVNRKIDMVLGIVLGLSEEMDFCRKKEMEAYSTIANASKLLLKGENASLVIFDKKKADIKENFNTDKQESKIKKDDLLEIGGIINIKKSKKYIIVSSPNEINGIRSYIKIEEYSEEEEKKPKNIEILKVFASQALFVYSFAKKNKKAC